MISTKYPSLGTTSEGAAWAMKALHPALKITEEIRGIPDADAFPCVVMNYEQVMTVGSQLGGTWAADIYSVAHPVHPCCVNVKEGYSYAYGGMVNATLTSGATKYGDYHAAFAKLCHSYRMLYHSVTVDLDASGLNNQGTVVAAQFPMASQIYNISSTDAVTGEISGYAHVLNTNWQQNFPGTSVSQLPGAFSGLAQDGVYMPLKIDPHSPWANTFMGNIVTSSNPISATYVSTELLRGQLMAPSATAGTSFPFWSGAITNPTNLPIAPAVYNPAIPDIGGSSVVPLQQKNIGLSSFYNLSADARLTITVRWGVEMRVPPLSTLAPAMQPSSMVDSLALTAYSDLAARLPWAYPSSYNAEGKLLGILKAAWNTIKPVLGAGLHAVPNPLAKMAGTALLALPNFERPSGSSTVHKSDDRKPQQAASQRGRTMERRQPQRKGKTQERQRRR